MQYWYLPHIFLDFVSVCTAQYAELGLIFTMPFVGIRIILVLRLSFAASKPDEILSLSTGDHQDTVLVFPVSIPLTFLNLISVCTYQFRCVLPNMPNWA